jgi:hypothetical protein
MKLTVTVDTDQYAGLSWPQGVPLPAAGDEVTLDHDGRRVNFVVDRCAFDLTGGDPQGPHINIQGHHATPGSV